MKTIQELTEWLVSEHKYTAYDTRFDYPYTFKTSLSKRVESESVCDCNDKLSIFITVSQIHINDILHESVDISITADKNSKWWVLKSYSLSKNEVIQDLLDVEKTLIKLFNQI